jgi:hypothetical protein
MIVCARQGHFVRVWGEGVFTRAHGITMGPDAADVLASVLFTTLGYTIEETDQVVEEHIAPALITYLTSHGPRLTRSRGHTPAD